MANESTIFSPTVVTVKTKHLSFDALISNRQRISEIDIYQPTHDLQEQSVCKWDYHFAVASGVEKFLNEVIFNWHCSLWLIGAYVNNLG